MSFTPSASTTRLLFSTTGGNPAVPISATWNNAATTFTGIRFDVTDTASAAGSLLMDLRVGGVSRFTAYKDGSVEFGVSRGKLLFSYAGGTFSGTQWLLQYDTSDSSNQLASFTSSGIGLSVNRSIFWTGSSSPLPSGGDLFLVRDAADTLAQRRGVNAQAFRIYNTFTDASNYERAALQWQSNELQLRVDGAGTGQNRPLQIVVGGQIVAYFNSAGNRSVALGAGAVATNATSGFVYVPTCAGLPTGGPEIYTGRAAIVIDTTNNKLYFYSGGSWRDAGP